MVLTTKTIELYVRPKTSLEDKVYLKTYYHHSQFNIEMDETPTKIQVHILQIACWTLTEEQQLVWLNLGT
jgi:glutamine cyclotransferase